MYCNTTTIDCQARLEADAANMRGFREAIETHRKVTILEDETVKDGELRVSSLEAAVAVLMRRVEVYEDTIRNLRGQVLELGPGLSGRERTYHDKL